ncbi:transcriptional regulator [Desulfocurvibacter africanus]|uniref:transcriptional regulator n=1 Tax=Desulfocurvibacter africanus TaxID=873 RepID=UPI00040F7B38|nr:transcriptional regulator [Desulfocurvibacter africanus]
MKAKVKGPYIPPERGATERRTIMDLLRDEPMTAKDLSAEAGIAEKRVLDALEHIRRSAPSQGLRLVVEPARCRSCGFAFAKRDRLGKPGHCPMCKKTFIEEPKFRLEEI